MAFPRREHFWARKRLQRTALLTRLLRAYSQECLLIRFIYRELRRLRVVWVIQNVSKMTTSLCAAEKCSAGIQTGRLAIPKVASTGFVPIPRVGRRGLRLEGLRARQLSITAILLDHETVHRGAQGLRVKYSRRNVFLGVRQASGTHRFAA